MLDKAMRPRMTVEDFVRKWGRSSLGESQGSHEHFIDLCHVLGEMPPAEADPSATDYCFEKAVAKTDRRPGRADVWKRGCFAWEYKGPGRNLDAAYAQLQRYAPALANPPLLIVSDMARVRVYTNWTNAVTVTHEIGLRDLLDSSRLDILKWAFSDPERLRPGQTRAMLTEEVAARFATLAARMVARGRPSSIKAERFDAPKPRRGRKNSSGGLEPESKAPVIGAPVAGYMQRCASAT